MSLSNKAESGIITWVDLTIEDAEQVSEFYRQVVGWTSSPVAMGGYNDFNMITPGSNKIVAGICHARGGNAYLPAQWLIYITVTDVEKSAAACEALGGKVLARPGSMGSYGKFCVIQDPAGAVAALFEPV